MLPVLRLVADGKEHRVRDVVEELSDIFQLTPKERDMMLPSGTARLFANRVGWARTYLKRAGAVESRKHGHFNITRRGKKLLAQHPLRIDNSILHQFPEFVAFTRKKGPETSTG